MTDTDCWRCSYILYFFVNQVNNVYFSHPRSVKQSLSTTCEGLPPFQRSNWEKKTKHSTSFPCNHFNQSKMGIDYSEVLEFFFCLAMAATATNSFNRLCSGNTVRGLHDELLTAPPLTFTLNVNKKHR